MKEELLENSNIVSNKYRIIKLLGEGSYGKALLAEEIVSKTLLVVKSIIIPGSMSKKEKENALQEGKILSQLGHPNIIKFIEVIIEKQDICPPITSLHIIMAYADGGDLLQKIKAQNGKLFQEDQIVNWFTQICLAIKHIHDRKILHRDIKSQNIFMTQTGRIQLGDFGIAKCLNNTIDKAKTIVGTPYYLSPEIINNEPYEYKSDIWSLGVLLYEMCMLTVPFNAQNLPQLTIKIIKGSYPPISQVFSKELINVVKIMLSVNIKQRPTIYDILSYPIFKMRIRLFLNESEYQKEFNSVNSIQKSSNPICKEEKDSHERERSSITKSSRGKVSEKQIKSNEMNDSFENNHHYHLKNKGSKKEMNNKCLLSQPSLIKNCKSNNQFIYKKKTSQINSKKKHHSIDFNLSPGRFISNKKLMRNDKSSNRESNAKGVDLNRKKSNEQKQNSNQCLLPKEELKKNLILEEFMKNKQEKIKHSYQISECINNSIWFKNNIKSIKDLSEQSITINSINVCIPETKANDKDIPKINWDNDINPQQMLYEINQLECDKTIIKEDIIKEPSIPSDNYPSNNSSIIAEAINSKEEVNEEIIPLDLDILTTQHKEDPINSFNHRINEKPNPYTNKLIFSPEYSLHNKIKQSIQTAVGNDIYSNLYTFIKNNVNDDIVNYDYSKLTNKFCIAYPHISQQQLKKALLYIPDIYFLILTENNSI